MMKQLRKFARRHPTLASLEIKWQLRLAEWRGEAAIIVYQMGKVGSSTAVASLQASGLNKPIYHIHSLTGEGFKSGKTMYTRMFPGEPKFDMRRMRHLLVSEQLQKRLASRRSAPQWKVITLVRDPVARNISDYFQVIDYWFPRFEQRFQAGELGVDDLVTTYMKSYHHDEPLNWFDIELNHVLGVDVYASGFPQSQGYKIYRRERIEVLVLKLEKLNECAAAAFSDFLGLDDVKIIGANSAAEKNYHSLYKRFKAQISLSDEYLEKMYTSRYARHFYTEAELQSFISQWKRT